MKKFILLWLILFVPHTIFSKTFSERNRGFGMSLLVGEIGAFDSAWVGAFGFNMNICGLYMDLVLWPSEHSSDVGVDEWGDEKGVATHIGYQIPLSDKFRIIPIFGIASASYGTTDGSNWNITGSGISNSYSADEDWVGLDYGIVLSYKPKKVNFQLTGTRHCIYAGVGFEI